jgi:hypothetical protein
MEIVSANLRIYYVEIYVELLPKHGWAIAHPAHPPLTPLDYEKERLVSLVQCCLYVKHNACDTACICKNFQY